jgi:tagatose-6-phosphate ketose/aldose isomerase
MATGITMGTDDKIECLRERLSVGNSRLAELLRSDSQTRDRLGYGHTLREICQQPVTWADTARSLVPQKLLVSDLLRECKAIAFTGSGSSEYAGACLHLGLRQELGLPVDSVPAALILTQPGAALPALRPALLVSLARSGDSPESCAAVRMYLRTEPEVRHLVITCNPNGRLALENADDPRVGVILLDERTNDRGLAMTSSFTNMVLAGGFLSGVRCPERYVEKVDRLAAIAEMILATTAGELAKFAAAPFQKAVFLGSGSAFGAAREGALKMLELTAGRITTMSETPLGLRHGPMSWVDHDTAIVCFLSSDPVVRKYECDLLQELDEKQIGVRRVIVGDAIPFEVITPTTTPVECPGLAFVGDSHAQPVYVLTAQLLAFFRSLEERLRPDTPSETGVISRVVREFRIYGNPGEGSR